MSHPNSKLTVVGLPGAGFDHTFIETCLTPLAHQLDANVIAADPEPGKLLDGYLKHCDEAARSGPFICVGISIGAIAAMHWWIENSQILTSGISENCLAIIAAMAPWTGTEYATAPAAHSAKFTSESIKKTGFTAVRNAMATSSPSWLSELQLPCWDNLGTALGKVMDEVSTTAAPELAALRTVNCPCGLIRVTDDPLHPASVTSSWMQVLPHCESETISLGDIASDVTVFSRVSLKLLRKLKVVDNQT